jgi:small subunit ribosomal protein S1
VKQLEQDPFGQYMAANPKGSKVEGVVKEVDAKGAIIELADGIEGYVRRATSPTSALTTPPST